MWLMQPRNKGRGFNAQPRIGCWTWLPGRYWPTISARPVYLILIRQPCMYIWSLAVVEEVLVSPAPRGSTRQDPKWQKVKYSRIFPLCVHWSFRIFFFFFSSIFFFFFFFSIEFERTIGREGERDRTFNLARENNGGERRRISGWWIRDTLSRSKLISIGIRLKGCRESDRVFFHYAITIVSRGRLY